jgi:hypothetical protein
MTFEIADITVAPWLLLAWGLLAGILVLIGLRYAGLF